MKGSRRYGQFTFSGYPDYNPQLLKGTHNQQCSISLISWFFFYFSTPNCWMVPTEGPFPEYPDLFDFSNPTVEGCPPKFHFLDTLIFFDFSILNCWRVPTEVPFPGYPDFMQFTTPNCWRVPTKVPTPGFPDFMQFTTPNCWRVPTKAPSPGQNFIVLLYLIVLSKIIKHAFSNL